MQRNAHSSTIDALVLSGMRPTFVAPELDPELGIAHCLTPESLDEALTATPGAVGALIVSPTYFGAVADVRGLAEVAHAHGVALVADEAWGAHMAFHEDLPEHALAAGADLVISSTHKIVGSLTQSAMLHLGERADELIGDDNVDRAVTLTESTSPNALLYGSLDAARRQAAMHGRELLEHTMAALHEAREQIKAIDGLDVLDERLVGRSGVAGYDPLRLAVDVRGIAASGYEMAGLLREIGDINLELYGQNVIVAVFGIGERRLPEAKRLVEALREAAAPRRPGSRWGVGLVRRRAAVGRIGDDPARGLPGRPGGRAGGAGGGTDRRGVARHLPARHPQRAPRRAADGRDAGLHPGTRSSWAAASAAPATVSCARCGSWSRAVRADWASRLEGRRPRSASGRTSPRASGTVSASAARTWLSNARGRPLARELLEFPHIFGDLHPLARQLGVDLEVELQRVGRSEHVGLLLVELRAGQPHRSLGQLVGVAMPLQRPERRRHSPEYRVRAAAAVRLTGQHAELRPRPRGDPGAEARGQQLRPEAHPPEGLARPDGLADQAALARQPGMSVVFAGAHRAPHRDDPSEVAPVG